MASERRISLKRCGIRRRWASTGSASDAPLIREGAERAIVSTIVVNEGRELAVDLEITAGRANKARLNRSPVRSAREVLGVLRAVLFAPEDLALVRGEPGERRRYLDELATTRRPAIAGVRADYDKVLRQRTALLKTAAGARYRGDSGALGDARRVGRSPRRARRPAHRRTGRLWSTTWRPRSRRPISRWRRRRGRRPSATAAASRPSRPRRPTAPSHRSSSRRRCWTSWPGGARPNSNAACVWSARTATTSSCGSAINRRKALPAMVSRGRWRWHCGWPPTNCCARTAAIRCCCSMTCSPNWTRHADRALVSAAESAEQVLVTAAVVRRRTRDWDARRMEIGMRDGDTGRYSEVIE